MSERKKLKKKGKGKDDELEKVDINPGKEEYKVASYIKSKLPAKKTKFLNHQVSYFNGNKAIDILLDSSWATGKSPIFTDRASVVAYGNMLLQHKFFHRAKKIAVTDKDLSPKELKKKKERETLKEEKGKESKVKEKDKKKTDAEDDQEETEKNESKEKEKEKAKEKDVKKKTKIKLDMHLEQVFVDGSDAYIWMYDPIPFWYYIAGALMLFSAVAICLFPLWPPYVRQGVYYLSMAAASFLGVIFGLTILRFMFFCFIWALSMGRHHFWILPNLTEDVGFFASFWPLYHYEYRGDAYDKRKKSKKIRSSDQEGDSGLREASDKEGGATNDNLSAVETDKPETDCERVTEGPSDPTDATDSADSHSENSNSQTFEIVDKEELQKEQNDELSQQED